ncbi:hypothetical protein HK096_010946, partial [Nowakowskiella sp. JEL0078]
CEEDGIALPFHEATEIVSADKCTTFGTCIPLYNELLDHLEKYMDSEAAIYLELGETEKEDMLEAASSAFDKLKDYYNKQADIVASFVDPSKYETLRSVVHEVEMEPAMGTILS